MVPLRIALRRKMPKRRESPWELHPRHHDVSGCRWELVEPFLHDQERLAKDQPPEDRPGLLGCWSAVKDVRWAIGWDEKPVLAWVVYGKSLFGPYERDRFAWRTKCPNCGHDAASLVTNHRSPIQRCCRVCRLDHERAMARLAARRRRRAKGEVTTPAVIPCTHCGTIFTPKRSTAQFCSTACRVAAHRARSAESAD
jgi:ribosomal protein L32